MSFNGFVNSFTNSPIQPSDVSYLPLTYSTGTTVQLEWVFQNPATLTPFCQFINVTGSGSTLYTIQLPNALYSSTVQSAIVYNEAASNVTLTNFSGTEIGTCEPGIAYFVGNTDNTTTTGDWLVITLGAGSASVIASQLIDQTTGPGSEPNAGGLIALSNHLKINQVPFVYTGTAYSVTASDRGNVVTFTNASSSTYTLPSPASVGNGFITGLQNRSTGAAIITVSVGSPYVLYGPVGVAANFQMQVNESTYFISDGVSNWYTFLYSSNIQYVIQKNQTDLTSVGGGTYTVPNTSAIYQIQIFTSSYSGTTTVLFPGTVTQQYFIANNSTTASLLVYLAGDSAPYQYTVPPQTSISTFSDGIHLYLAPSTVVNEKIELPDGSIVSPSLTFLNDTTLGLSRNTASGGGMIVSDLATNIAEFKYNALDVNVPLVATEGINTENGTNIQPAYSFTSADTTGLYYDTVASGIGITITGTEILQVKPTGTNVLGSYFQYGTPVISLSRAYGI